jgi:uncharacterized protein (TIGR03437 family)
VDVFSYTSATGALGASPLFTIPILDTPTFYGMDQIALHPSGTKLYVSQPGAVKVYNASTGAPITTITSASIVAPSGVCMRSAVGTVAAATGCPEHSVHGHIDTNPPGHYAGIASHIHQDQHGHHIPLVNGCPPTHAYGHSLGLTADAEPDFVAALNQEGNLAPARRGSVVQLFGHAAGLYLGADDNQPADQFIPDAAGSPMYFTTSLPRVLIGGVEAKVVFSGLVPGLKGAWQINVVVPDQAPAGKLPVTVSYEEYELRSVDIAVE